MSPKCGTTPIGRTPTPSTGTASRWDRVCEAFIQVVTEKDNETHSIWKWSLLFCVGAVVTHDFYRIAHGAEASATDLGTALAAVVAGHGLGSGMGGGK